MDSIGMRRCAKPVYKSVTGAEIYAHDLSKRDQVWPKTTDPVTQHPMAPRLVHILETYRRLYKETGKMQPLVKNAR